MLRWLGAYPAVWTTEGALRGAQGKKTTSGYTKRTVAAVSKGQAVTEDVYLSAETAALLCLGFLLVENYMIPNAVNL